MSLRRVQYLALLLVPLAVLVIVVQAFSGSRATLSRWGFASTEQGSRGADALVGRANAVVGMMQPAANEQLEAFNRDSSLQERVAEGRVEWYRRPVGGGELAYIVVRLDEMVHLELITADGALPGSDEHGDTIWLDRQRHLATVATMANAPYAQREGLELLAAMAFGFHGAVRTSNEGSVVINGVIHRVNAGRGVLCLTYDQRALIGLFDATALAACWQAVGGGPVMLWEGKIANPERIEPGDGELPFNPLNEDFVQLDWRIMIYQGTYPKTAVCVGDLPNGHSFVVLANSRGITGVELAQALRAMGCRDALGGDDDTSTQATWRGQPIWPGSPRAVPDAIGVYVR
ncbi:phosphodiester glycosidase family protein [Candidatus Chloroploca sp. M-50]|uniref:Phosphodiester glycosidase family protein n=1 Tax=Candidatus Chloroploca mongolica TaxID=2528176 RepID=A0ABS4D8J0_9CHLR|nr:phosphodiester glycosidase family protein [Candidatus Chloroploca mongolica]MBP1465762.1 phosphodiester glycosidase family protein [Candidatus Chloroploca mongolica]